MQSVIHLPTEKCYQKTNLFLNRGYLEHMLRILVPGATRAKLCCMMFMSVISLSAGNKEGTHSTFWVLLSILLGAVAMLCKEQGITVLVRPEMQSGPAPPSATVETSRASPASVTSSTSQPHYQPVRDPSISYLCF